MEDEAWFHIIPPKHPKHSQGWIYIDAYPARHSSRYTARPVNVYPPDWYHVPPKQQAEADADSKQRMTRDREAVEQRKRNCEDVPVPYGDHKEYGFQIKPAKLTTQHPFNMFLQKRTHGRRIATPAQHDGEIFESDHESGEGGNIDGMMVCSTCSKYLHIYIYIYICEVGEE